MRKPSAVGFFWTSVILKRVGLPLTTLSERGNPQGNVKACLALPNPNGATPRAVLKTCSTQLVNVSDGS